MKNLFLTLAFVLGTTMSFASSNAVAEDEECTHVTLSCGVEYDICNFTGTVTQLINSVISDNNDVCGTDIGTL
jgi:hypothetical protein